MGLDIRPGKAPARLVMETLASPEEDMGAGVEAPLAALVPAASLTTAPRRQLSWEAAATTAALT